jgi:DNA helicase-2/ATP-dependent DNA helicase PcrA
MNLTASQFAIQEAAAARLTDQQTAYIDHLLNQSGHICLRARAGTGKTSTILAGIDRYVARYPAHELLVCCFGRAIKKEIAAKLEERGHTDWRKVQASTTHAMGWGLVRFAFKLNNDQIDDNKVRSLIRAQNEATYRMYEAQIQDLVHYAKMDGFGFFDDVQIGDTHAWYQMADHYGINSFDDTTDMDLVVEAAQRIYRLSLEQTDRVDFDDMVLWPLVKNIRVRFGKDVIFVDEAQDSSRARCALVKKFLKPRGRMVVVGDDRQAIMGFAGASADALDELVRDLRATVLPLTVTWRCPKAVVRLAQELVPDIMAADDAAEGEVQTLEAMPDELYKTDAILCRNTAPLITTAYQLIRRGVACKVEGRDIGTGLLRVVDRWKQIKTITAFTDKLADYRERETQKAVAKGKDSKVQEVNDRCDTLLIICEAVTAKGLSTLDAVRDAINSMFSDDVTAQGLLTLCTYHRSKGREWPRVLLIEHHKRCPSPWATRDWEVRQEYNLAYVAITRTQQTLAFIG